MIYRHVISDFAGTLAEGKNARAAAFP